MALHPITFHSFVNRTATCLPLLTDPAFSGQAILVGHANEGYYEGNINILSVIPPYIFAAMDTSGIWKRKLSDFSASSVPAFTANQSFSIFPDNLNPGHIIIQSDLDAPFTGNIELFSISGCKIFSHSCKMLQHSRNEIQLPQVSPGLYFLTLSGDHLTLTYKLSLR